MTIASTGLNEPIALRDWSGTRVRTPIFLVGCVRSGTTLLRLMLDHHPKVAFQEEFEYVIETLPQNGGWPDLEAYHEWLSTHRIFLWSGFQVDRRLDYVSLCNSFLEQKRLRDRKGIVGATVHHDFDRLLRIWPDAKFIHLLRDGRDVARSIVQFGWAGNLWTAADRWIAVERLWERMRSDVPADRRLEVCYETLIRRPRETLEEICEFIGVEFNEQIFDYAKNSTYELPDPTLLEQWRTKLTRQQLQLIETRIGDLLFERGYELSGLPRLNITPAMERRLRRQDWRARVLARIKAYGALLFASEFLARRCRINCWYRHVRLKMNRIELARLK